MKAAALRQAIFQAAARGRLAPQDPSEEPAAELLNRMRLEKARLVADGKIKKEKPLPPITSDEPPYGLPAGWVWVRLIDVCKSISAGGDKPADFSQTESADHSVPVIANGETNEGIVGYTGTAAVFEESVTISGRGTVGYSCVRYEPYFPIVRLLVVLPLGGVRLKYLKFVFDAMFESGVGASIPQLTVPMVKPKLIPLPPLREQERIIAKVDELTAMCDELEAAEKALDDLEDRLAKYMPRSILQAAAQGKLVPQDPNDEPATELLKRIRQEKARLIRDGKIKKEKPLPPVSDGEPPYALPSGWVWCRLGDIVGLTRGITFPGASKSTEAVDGFIRCATTGSVQSEYNPSADVYVPESYVKNESQWLVPGDIIMSSANSKELVGKSCFWLGGEKTAFGGFLTTVRVLHEGVDALYLYYGLQHLSKSGIFAELATHTTNIANLNNDIVSGTLFPLPPLAEQRRIAAKADELMALCGELKAARIAPAAFAPPNIIPFPAMRPQAKEEPADEYAELGLAARGGGARAHSVKLQRDIDAIFGDGDYE